MSNGAGEYCDRVEWLQRSIEKDTTNGQDKELFTSVGYLWASVELNSGRRQRDYGADQTGADATVRIRNYPAVSALDRLVLGEWNEVWVLENIRRGDNEIIAEANKFDTLELGGMP